MIRHSLNHALWKLTKEIPMRFDNEILGEAIQYLNSLHFHKRLRNGVYAIRFKAVLGRGRSKPAPLNTCNLNVYVVLAL